jgi:hypothetical protein
VERNAKEGRGDHLSVTTRPQWVSVLRWRVMLTFRSVDLRSVLVPLKRPVVSKVGLFDQWPMILIDLYTEEGIVGRSYLRRRTGSSGRTGRTRFSPSRSRSRTVSS